MRASATLPAFLVSLLLFLESSASIETAPKGLVDSGASVEGGDGDSRFFKAVAAAVERKHMAADQTSWPELVGVQCEAAKQALESATDKKVFVVPANSMVTMDYRTDRIRIFCAEDGTVSKAPRVG